MVATTNNGKPVNRIAVDAEPEGGAKKRKPKKATTRRGGAGAQRLAQRKALHAQILLMVRAMLTLDEVMAADACYEDVGSCNNAWSGIASKLTDVVVEYAKTFSR